MLVIWLAVSLFITPHIHGANGAATTGKRKVAPLDEEADTAMKDVNGDDDSTSKKQKLDSKATVPACAAAAPAAASASATAMEIDHKEIAHELPAPNQHSRLLQLYEHYDLSSSNFNRQRELSRALYALRTAIDNGENVDTAYDCGTTILHRAIHGEVHEVIALLLHKGAHVHATRHNDDSTPLHYAVGGVFFDPNERDERYANYPPIDGLKESTLSLFANRGFDFNRRDKRGLTPLLASLAYWGRPHHIRFLVRQGACATTTANGHGALWTLFNCDRRYRNHRNCDLLEMTQVLVRAGADFQSPSPEGRSPLYDAWGLRNKTSHYGYERRNMGKVISWLIGIGAKIVVPNNEIFSIRDLLYARGPNDDYIDDLAHKDDSNQPMDEAAEKLWGAMRDVVPGLCETPLTKQPNFTRWHVRVTCGHLIHSYFLSHPLIEEGYRQRKQNEHLLRRCLALCFNRCKPGLRDLVTHIQRFAGPIIPDHHPEAGTKRAHAAQVVPMEEGE